jgi:hypothetical protein
MSDASKNIFHVYHIRIVAPKKNGSHDMKQTDSSIIIVRNVFVCKIQYFPVEILSGGKNLILNLMDISAYER